MIIYNRPNNLRKLMLLGLLILPLIALNIAVYEKTSVIKAFANAKNIQSFIFLSLWAVLTLFWISRGRWLGFISSGLLSGAMLYGNAYFMLATKNYGLAFFALGLLILSTFYSINLYQVISLEFFDSGRKWFEQYPRFIPELKAELISDAIVAEGRVYALGNAGCFIYTDNKEIFPKSVKLILGDSQSISVESKVSVVSKTRDKTGVGICFITESDDRRKDLSDFINKVRCYGFIQK